MVGNLIDLKRKKINYLSNKELLRELMISKSSYSYYSDVIYKKFDLIITDLNQIDDNIINEAKKIRSNYINEEKIRKIMIDDGISAKKAMEKISKELISPSDIKDSEVCFRLMTFEHIPQDIIAKHKKNIYAKIMFPPFKHYARIDNKITEVGRSHWRNGFDDGEFCLTHGKPTHKLLKSLMMLVDKYSTKANWRGYSYLDDMKGQALYQLSLVSLQFDESKSQNPFAFYTAIATNSFNKILKSEKQIREIRDNLMIQAGFNASFGNQIDMENADN